MDRTVVALVLLITFYLLGFGLRIFVHRKRTGSSGIAGLDAGLPGRIGGVAFVTALIAGLAAPIAERLGWIAPIFVPTLLTATIGAAIAAAGIAATWWAQSAMGRSWRIGVSPSARTDLVERGPFRWIRNPIFSFMLATSLGLALLLPNPLSIAALLLLVLGVELQVRFVEEPYLEGVHGDAYRDYCSRVGRFLPWIGRGLSPARTGDNIAP